MENDNILKNYLKDICKIYSFQRNQYEILYYLLTKVANKENEMIIDADVKKRVAKELNRSYPAIHRFLKEAVERGIFARPEESTFIPDKNLFGTVKLENIYKINIRLEYKNSERFIETRFNEVN